MLLLKRALQWYKTIIVEPLDPRPTQWPFTGNLMWPLGIIALYVWIVKHKGPELMANRKAFDLKWVLVAFNASQVIINAYLFYLALSLGWLNGYSLRCQPVDYSTSELAMEIVWGVYLYYVVKLVDLLDTVFYVMRKRDRQISFLHVYHHAGMVLLTYIGACYFPGGNSILLGTLNTFVHVVMYSYYLSTALRPTYHDRIWWKKYLTQLQMVQFLLIILHTLQLLWEDCGYPRWIAYVLVPQNVFMLTLFADFYRHNYLRKPRKAQAQAQAQAQAAANGGACGAEAAAPQQPTKPAPTDTQEGSDRPKEE